MVPVPSFTVTRWAWLRANEPDVAAATRAVRLPHDWITERLSGHGATDRGDASGSGWWSTRDEDYVDEVLGLPGVELERALLPDVLGPRRARRPRCRRAPPPSSACPRARWWDRAPATTWAPPSAWGSRRASR